MCEKKGFEKKISKNLMGHDASINGADCHHIDSRCRRGVEKACWFLNPPLKKMVYRFMFTSSCNISELVVITLELA